MSGFPRRHRVVHSFCTSWSCACSSWVRLATMQGSRIGWIWRQHRTRIGVVWRLQKRFYHVDSPRGHWRAYVASHGSHWSVLTDLLSWRKHPIKQYMYCDECAKRYCNDTYTVSFTILIDGVENFVDEFWECRNLYVDVPGAVKIELFRFVNKTYKYKWLRAFYYFNAMLQIGRFIGLQTNWLTTRNVVDTHSLL